MAFSEAAPLFCLVVRKCRNDVLDVQLLFPDGICERIEPLG